MSLEKNVFNFEISVRFEYLVDVYDIEENKQHVNNEKIICIYGGLKTKDAVSAIVIEQAEEVKSITMLSYPEVRPLIEEAGHIYDSTVITSYSKIN